MNFILATPLITAILIATSPACAQLMPKDHVMKGPMAMPMPQATPAVAPVTTATPPPPDTPSTAALIEATAKMHRAMDIRYSGKPSLDFVSAMTPHHRGAIEMAQIALRYSTDRQTRRLAQKIIAAQEAEIVQMNAIARRLQR
jgi:uncharacterized protein (DUF305 family)